jgi:hypothetical protein
MLNTATARSSSTCDYQPKQRFIKQKVDRVSVMVINLSITEEERRKLHNREKIHAHEATKYSESTRQKDEIPAANHF